MERKIGEIFEYNGEWYQCVEGNSCENCAFHKDICKYYRIDNCTVIFKKLEKVGEPIVFKDKLLQKMKTPVAIGCEQCAINNKGCAILYEKCHTGELYVKIKQNKENMEEKKIKLTKEEYDYIKNQIKIIILPGNTADDVDDDKLVNEIMDMFSIDTEHSNSEKIGKNLKEFDINLAKAGKPVCTRDGRKARIICFDREGAQPIVALILNERTGHESIEKYFRDGYLLSNYRESEIDLMMYSEKKEGWINVYKTNCGIKFSEQPYSTREEAIKNAAMLGRIDTIKVEWEE